MLGTTGDDSDDAEANTLTFGIGLHSTGEMKIEGVGQLQRKRTINLKGKKGGGGAKRRSATYGQSFKSLPTAHAGSAGECSSAHFWCSSAHFLCSSAHCWCSSAHFWCSSAHFWCSSAHFWCSSAHCWCSSAHFWCSSAHFWSCMKGTARGSPPRSEDSECFRPSGPTW